MHVHNGRYPSGRDTSLIHVDEEKDDVEEERPDDALTCPLLDTPIHFDDCTVCQGAAGSVRANRASLGAGGVPCMSCGGEGEQESGGPVTWT